jgi:hypothetical protein
MEIDQVDEQPMDIDQEEQEVTEPCFLCLNTLYDHTNKITTIGTVKLLTFCSIKCYNDYQKRHTHFLTQAQQIEQGKQTYHLSPHDLHIRQQQQQQFYHR